MAPRTGKGNSSPTDGGTAPGPRKFSFGKRSTDTFSNSDPKLLARMLDRLTEAGHAVVLGRTSDGGALSLVFLVGTEKFKVYPKDSDELCVVLEEVIASLTEGAE